MGQLSEPLCGQCRQPTVLQSVIAKLGQQPELHLHKCLHCGLVYLFHLREGSWLEYCAKACLSLWSIILEKSRHPRGQVGQAWV
jgi:hypothetical protein